MLLMIRRTKSVSKAAIGKAAKKEAANVDCSLLCGSTGHAWSSQSGSMRNRAINSCSNARAARKIGIMGPIRGQEEPRARLIVVKVIQSRKSQQ